MAKLSAGLLVYRVRDGIIELLLVHPGGPFWAKRDLAAWSIPKGEYETGEDPLEAARREFSEETSAAIAGPFLPLSPVKQPGGKTVAAWLVRGDMDVSALVSNSFSLEWPPRSGRLQSFPEVDRAAWFTPEAAAAKILKAQAPLISEALECIQSLLNCE